MGPTRAITPGPDEAGISPAGPVSLAPPRRARPVHIDLVCAAAGLDTDGYSFPYVASWANGASDRIRATADAAIGCARRIAAAAGLAGTDEQEAAA